VNGSTTSSYIQVSHHGQAGTGQVSVRTPCTYHGSSFSFQPTIPGSGGSGEPYPTDPPDDCDQPVARIYPNPSTEKTVTVEPPCDSEIIYVTVGNQRSKKIRQQSDQYEIDVSALSPGMHLIRAKDSKGKEHVIRFVKGK
jgi:hypothetical protein